MKFWREPLLFTLLVCCQSCGSTSVPPQAKHYNANKNEAVANQVKYMLQNLTPLSEWQKVNRVNHWINNQLQQSTDINIWQVEDYWASPLEALRKEAADCEDYAVAKYFLLIEAGVPPSKLVLSHVDYQYQEAPHMVLIYENTEDNGFYVLDNIVSEIKPSFLRQDLTYKYSFNATTLFTGRPPSLTVVSGSNPNQIKVWAEVLQKWEGEKALLD